MNYYITLGIKILAVIILSAQTIITLCTFAAWLDEWVEHDIQANGVLVVGIILTLLFTVTIPTACWVFNF